MQLSRKHHAVLTEALERAKARVDGYERLAPHFAGLRKPLEAAAAREEATHNRDLASALTTALECADPVDDEEAS